MRLDKLLSDLNFGTRKSVKELLKKKVVTVNGQIEKDGKAQVHPEIDKIMVAGELVQYEPFVYYLLHKPQGVITATKDTQSKTVLDFIATEDFRKDLYPVGRLDKDTEGLLLITNDGPLGHDLLSPKKHVDKTYQAVVTGIATEKMITAFTEGLTIDGDEKCLPAKLTILKVDEAKQESTVEIVLQEGKYHQVKRMCHACGHEVIYLKRIAMGNLVLPADLPKGEYLKLTKEQVYEGV